MIKVAGCNAHKQLISNLNCKIINGFPVICPPQDIQVDASTLLSISLYDDHTVCVLPNGKAVAYGNNDGNRIYNALPNGTIEKLEYEIYDDNGKPCKLLSAVCGYCYTLYMAYPAYEGQGSRLIYISQHQNNKQPLFLNIGNNHPIALFGGNTACSAITSEGSVIIINKSVLQVSNSEIKPVSLPNNEKAISVSCCDHFIFALSSDGHVFKSTSSDNFSSFTIIEELASIKILWISGSCRHCLSVSNDGSVYACGSNGYGEIALNDDSKEFEKFTLIESLKDHHIVAAYAGYSHSLFQTKKGLILGCGNNGYDQLLLNEPTYTNNYLPLETSIIKDASFCIAGHALSVVFINCTPPPNCPNQMILNGLPGIPFLKKKDDVDSDGKINHMKHKIEKLKKKNSILKLKNDELHKEIWELKSQIAVMRKINEQKIENDEKELKKFVSQNFDVGIKNEENECIFREDNDSEEYENKIDEENNNNEDENGEFCELEILDSEKANELKTLKKLGKGMLSKSFKVSREEFFVLKVFNKFKIAAESSSSSNDNEGSDDEFELNGTQENFCAEKMKLLVSLYETLNKLNHPNIIKAISFFNGDSKHDSSILLDFCPGTLKGSVKRLSDVERVSIIFEIGKAMKCVHKLGIIHRNLKPENILIDSSKHVKISDFGSEILVPVQSQIKIANQKKNNHFSDSPKFIAPELFKAAMNHSSNYDEKVDVFSFGVIVFYVLMKGEFPKYGAENVLKGEKLINVKGLNQLAKKLINMCCAMSSNERPSFDEIVEIIKENNFQLIDGIEKKLHAPRSHLSF